MNSTDPTAVPHARTAGEPLAQRLAMEAPEVGPGTAVVRMAVEEGCLNQFGTAHG